MIDQANFKKFTGTLNDSYFPEILYKYRNWDSLSNKRFILNREIFLAPTSSFEDKKDCKNPIRYDLLTDEQTVEFYIKISKKENILFSEQEHQIEAKTWANKKLFKDSSKIESYTINLEKEYDSRNGILSLTAEPCLNKMWNKYANNNKGFCIGYNSRIIFDYLGGGGQVKYFEELPTILPNPIMSSEEIHFYQLFAKEKKWDFEKEYRTHKFWKNPIEIKDRQISLPKEAFNCIILGSRISIENKDDLIKSVKKHIGDIPIIERKTS